AFAAAGPAPAACCYFSAKNQDILQPAQKVFLTYDPATGSETFTVQPRFEGNALDFGMVIPTPGVPKLHEMPKEFFKHLAVYTILKKRETPRSKLLPDERVFTFYMGNFNGRGATVCATCCTSGSEKPKRLVRVVEAGVVGSLDYKVLEADRADALFAW